MTTQSIDDSAPQDDGRRSLATRLATNSVVQGGGDLLASAISFATFVAVTRGLGPTAFGDFTAALAYLYIPVVLADVGLSSALLRELSGKRDRTEYAMRASLPLRAAIAFPTIVLATGLGLVMPFTEQTKHAILISALGSVFVLLNLGLIPYFQTELRLHLTALANIVGRVVALVATLGALWIGLGFTGVVWAPVIGLGVTFLMNLAFFARVFPLRPIIDTAYWGQLIKGSLIVGLALALGQIYFRIDAVILALLRPAREVGLYGAAFKMIELSQIAGAAVSAVILPTLNRMVAEDDPRYPGLVQKSFDVLLAAAVPLMVVMLTLSTEIVEVTSGSEFVEGAVALQIVAPYVIFSFVGRPLWSLLWAKGRDRLLLSVAALVLVANVWLNLLFIPVYGFKAAAATSTASEAYIFFVMVSAARRTTGFRLNWRGIVATGLAGVLMAATIVFAPGPALIAAAAGGFVYLVVLAATPGPVRELAQRVVRRFR